MNLKKKYVVAVAGIGYVRLPIATLLAQYQKGSAAGIIPEKVEMISDRQAPIQNHEQRAFPRSANRQTGIFCMQRDMGWHGNFKR